MQSTIRAAVRLALVLPCLALVLPCLALVLPCLGAAHAADRAGNAEILEEVVVTAPYGGTMARDRVPARVQTATTGDIEALQPLDITDLLNRSFGSVSINHAQNNPLQPDVNFRGQTASPLLGLPQGLSVFANGVRMNETFGDTVNWDLLPLSAIDSVQLLAGTNPVFGLNSLGGALSVRMKNGFNYEGAGLEGWGGSFSRYGTSAQFGGNNGTWGWYGNVDYFSEDGWRDFSKSDALRGMAALSYRRDERSLDLSFGLADSNLLGNGASPIELLEEDRAAVFTHPDQTKNNLKQVILEGSDRIGANLVLAGNAFYRNLKTSTFNGDGTIFEECDIGGDEFLVEEDFDDLDDDGDCSGADMFRLVLDPQGNPIEAELDDEELNAINNIGRRKQKSYGTSLQLTHSLDLGSDRSNDLLLGAAWQQGQSTFDSVVEVAALDEGRSTTRTGIHADEFRTEVNSRVTTWSLYAADTLDLTPRLSLTLATRYDSTHVTLADRSGQSPDLNGRHKFDSFNPAVGLAWRGGAGLLAYASISQASRVPTPVELACADEDAPCNLPNAFLADPPLDKVVARNAEIGVRGRAGAGLTWHAGAFYTVNKDDILFQTTGGSQANVGYFQNASDTRRQGIELELSQKIGQFGWKLDYTLVDATYRDTFVVNSPNHPLFGDDADDVDGADLIVGDDKLRVDPGKQIPAISRHMANLLLDWQPTSQLRLGTDLNYRSGVYLRGDEINVLDRTGSFVTVNLRGEYRFNDSLTAFARIENVFDTRYETFGLLGEPDEVFEEFEDPRFLGAGPPRGIWVGVRLKL